jgi:chromate transporter
MKISNRVVWKEGGRKGTPPMIPLILLVKRFLKIGATAYGGPAIAGHMKNAMVKEYGWMKEPEFLQGLAFCQMLPGPLFPMLSAYIGYRLRGIWGAFFSVLAFLFPSFVMVFLLSVFYFRWGDIGVVQNLFKGLGAIVVALVLHAVINFGRPLLSDWKTILIAGLSFIGLVLRWNILMVFVFAAGLALLLRPPIPGAEPWASSPAAMLPRRKGEDFLFLGGLAILLGGMYLACLWVQPRIAEFFHTLAKLGALSFGGAFTIIPLIQYEVVDRFQWVTTREFLDGIAIGQVTPGPISITATFLGYKLAGFWGAVVGTVAIYSPSFFIVILLIPQYDRLRGWVSVRRMQRGILAAFVGMLGLVFYNFARTTFVDIPSVIFTAGALLALLKKVDLAYILAVGAGLSILVFGV